MAAPATTTADVLLSEIYKNCDKMTLPLQTEAAAVKATDGDGGAAPKSTNGKGEVNGEKSEKADGKTEDDVEAEGGAVDGETHGDGGEDDEGNDDDDEDDDAVPDDDDEDDAEDDDDDDADDDEEADEEDDDEDEDDEAPPPPAAKKLKK